VQVGEERSNTDATGAVVEPPQEAVTQVPKAEVATEAVPKSEDVTVKPEAKRAEDTEEATVAEDDLFAARKAKKQEMAVFQGRGKLPEEIYGKTAVEEGRAVPILGKGKYYAFTREDASAYGDVSKANVSLKRPLVIDSDEKWLELLRKADAGHLSSVSEKFYTDPQGIPAAAERLRMHVIREGHDGIIVTGIGQGDINPKNDLSIKRMRKSRGR
jgi:hypothetical protein